MAHTVQTLSKLLKKTPDEVITILTNAGVDGKTVDSEISAEERKILMGSLSKRSTNKSSMSVSRKPRQVLAVLKSKLRKSALKNQQLKRLTLLTMRQHLKHKQR